jgi:hypothetical protein
VGEYEDIIGKIDNTGQVTEAVEKLKAAVLAGPVLPLVPIEVLERPSPTPFSGRPDPEYPDLDSGEPLYIPRFLVRKWGAERFLASGYYATWRSEAERGPRLAVDAKPGGKKK